MTIRLHIFSPGDVTATIVNLTGEEEEFFANLLASRVLSQDCEVCVEDSGSLISYEDFNYES